MFFEDNIDNAKYCGHLYGLGTSFVANGNNSAPGGGGSGGGGGAGSGGNSGTGGSGGTGGGASSGTGGNSGNSNTTGGNSANNNSNSTQLSYLFLPSLLPALDTPDHSYSIPLFLSLSFELSISSPV